MVKRLRPLGPSCSRGTLCGGAAASTRALLYAKSFMWLISSFHSGRPVREKLYMMELRRPYGLFCKRGALCGGEAASTRALLYAKSFTWWSGSVHSNSTVREELYVVERQRPLGLYCTQRALRGEVEAFLRALLYAKSFTW